MDQRWFTGWLIGETRAVELIVNMGRSQTGSMQKAELFMNSLGVLQLRLKNAPKQPLDLTDPT